MTATFRSVPSRLRALRPLALAAASLCAGGGLQAAGPVLPSGLQVVQGQATVQTQGRQLTVTNTAGALLNWQQFSIGAGEAVRFVQPSVSSKVLNRVVGQDPSEILGSLSSNGQVWLLNANGVLFGHSARVDVAGLVASTLRLDDDAWRAGLATGRFSLGGQADRAFSATVVNQGELRSTSGGRVLLIGGAGGVRNDGLIEAPDGQVVLAAGAQVDLVDTATPRLGLQLSAPQGEVLNLGRLSAGGGRIDLLAALVNQQGIVRADSLGPGGQVLVAASQGLTLGQGSRTSASGAQGGQVALDAGSGALLAAGQVSATAGGGVGGQISLLGRQVGLVDGALVDASGTAGGGAVRMGGGLQGRDLGFRNADANFFARGASILADATVRGDGGLVVLWGNQATRAYGTLSARGGPLGGDGGFIETSGGWLDARPLAVHTGAPTGRAGRWLLDPDDILIGDGASDTNITAGPDFSSTGVSSTLSTATLAAALNAGNNVSVTTSDSGTNSSFGFGDIRVSSAALTVSPTTAVSLTLNARRNIDMTGSQIQSLGAPLTVNLVAGAGGGFMGYTGNAVGGAIRMVGTLIRSAGGDITLGGPTVACGLALLCAAGNTGAVAGASNGRANGIELDSSALQAGTGAIRLDGHSLFGPSDVNGVLIQNQSVLSGRTIDIHGTVDFADETNRQGVSILGSTLSATERLRVVGSVQSAVPATDSYVSGLWVAGGSRLTIGGASTAAMALDGRVNVGTGADSFALIGLEIYGSGTALVATGGAAIDLVGQAAGDGFPIGISLGGSLTPMIDASAGNRLTLSSGSRIFTNSDILAPSGGQLSFDSGDMLAIDGMRLTGAPSQALLRGSTVAIGADGGTTDVSFDGNTALRVQAGQLVLGIDQLATGAANPDLPQKQALGVKRALQFAPPASVQTLLASGGPISIEAEEVQLGSQAVVYSSATGTAISLSGQVAGTAMTAFNNLGGAGALQAPDGRWLVHATDSADINPAFLPGALSASFWQYGATPGVTAVAEAGNGFLFAATPLLTLQGQGVVRKVYDGHASVDLTAAGLSVGGLRLGQTVVGDPAFADKNAATAKPLVPTAAANGNTVVAEDGTPIHGYGVDPNTMIGDIRQRPLSLSAVVVPAKVYDGHASATVSSWTLSGVLSGDQVQVQAGSAVFSGPGVGIAKPVLAYVSALSGADAANYSSTALSASSRADITPATLSYVANPLTLQQGQPLPALTGTVTGFVASETQATATQGQLSFAADAGAQAQPGLYAIHGTGLTAANYSFVQAVGNATALTLIAPPNPEPVPLPPINTLVTTTAVVAVLTPAQPSSPGLGRAVDTLAVVQGGSAGGRRFDSLDLDRMSAASVATALAARDAYKSEVFRAATEELAANPAAADAPGCATPQQAATGQCLLVSPLGSGLDISNARVVERAPVASPRAAPPAPATAPVQAAAPPLPQTPAAAPPPAPAAAAPRLSPMPADLGVNLPPRRPVARASVPQIQRKIAVLIGIDRYQDTRIPQLGNAVSDARAVARTMAQRLGYETVVLENPGKATIFRALNQLAAQVGPADSVVLYYAGHGERIAKTGLGYWQPADADASRAETWISNADIDRLLRQLPASQLAMVSDSCFSGSLVTGERIRGLPGATDPAALLGKRAVVVMTSGGNEPVFDSGLNGHSPFAWNLMQSLDQVGSWKSGSSVFEQVRFAVARKLPQRPQYGASSGGGHEVGADYLFEQRQLGER